MKRNVNSVIPSDVNGCVRTTAYTLIARYVRGAFGTNAILYVRPYYTHDRVHVDCQERKRYVRYECYFYVRPYGTTIVTGNGTTGT